MAAIDVEDIMEYKNETDYIWEEETNFTNCDNGEINVKNELDHKPKEYDVTEYTNETDHIWEEEKNYTSHDSGTINVKSEEDDKPIDFINREEDLKTTETFENVNHIKITNGSIEKIHKVDSPYCERCELRFSSQEAFDNHKICSGKCTDQRTIKIIWRLREPMVFNRSQFAKSPRVELWKYTAPPEYAGIYGARLKKPRAESLKEENSSKTSNEESHKTVSSVVNIPELSKNTKHMGETKGIPFKKSKANTLKEKNSKASNDEGIKTVNADANIPELDKKTEHLEETKDEINVIEGDKSSSFIVENPQFICNECGQRFDKKCSIILHIKTKHVKDVYIRCKKCAYSTVKKDSLVQHLKLHDKGRQHFCDVCNYRFTSQMFLKRHKKKCDIKNNVSIIVKPYSYTACSKNKHNLNTQMKTHSCVICQKTFNQNILMVRHMRNHTGKKSYSCELCNKQFNQICCLNAHTITHTGEKPFSCTVCNKQFNRSDVLNTHIRTHTGEKPYSCTVCNKQFSRSDILNKHIRIHTGEKPYSCSVCNKQFNRTGTLNTHMRAHTGKKPYSCTVCNKQFSRSDVLNKHIRIHTGEKTYSCSTCNHRFSRQDVLRSHMITHRDEKP